MANLPPKFGPFEPLHRLGAGGMAETFVALRRGPAGFEQRVCIKRILPAFESDQEFVRAFLSEARTSAALRHNNIVQVLDFGIVPEESSHYLALELVDGLDLRALLSAGAQFDGELVTLVASELAAALEYAHADEDGRQSVIHRDISPSNVLVSRAGEVKLTDFGIARVTGSGPRTATGVIKGKVPYMPPEYLEHGRFDARGDLFALGVLLFELLTGERPFEGGSELETMRRIVAGERKPMPECGPPALLSCIERLLATKVEQRLPSARALLEQLPPIAVNRARRRLAELVRTRSSCASQSVGAPLAPTEKAALALAPVTTKTRHRGLHLRPSRAALLALLLSGALLTAIGGAVLMRFSPRQAGASAAPPGQPLLPRSVGATLAEEGAVDPQQPERSASTTLAAAVPEQPAETREGARGEHRQEPRSATAPAELKVVVVPFGEVWVDDKYVGHAPISMRLPAGTHAIAVGEGRARLRRSVSLTAGEHQQLVFRTEQPQGEPSSGSP